jgi:radical SAM protein with 4Fe4S-binding SPASM domain
MKGRWEPRLLHQTGRLYAWQHGLPFAPPTVEISPTNICNQNCTYCYARRPGRIYSSLPDRILMDLMPQLRAAGVGGVLFQGTGEPLLHPAVPDAIAAGSASGLSVNLTTNGVPLTEPVCQKILPRLFQLKISVLDSDPDRYAHTHGCGRDHWRILVDNLTRAVALRARDKLPVGISASVYLSQDDPGLADLYSSVKFCRDLGVDFVHVTEAQHTTNSPAGRQPYASSQMGADDCKRICSLMQTLCTDDFAVRVSLQSSSAERRICQGQAASEWSPGFCQGIKFYALIASDAEVYPCWSRWEDKRFSYGSLRESTFSEIWNGSRRQKIEQEILSSRPNGDDCVVCHVSRLNAELASLKTANHWANFL